LCRLSFIGAALWAQSHYWGVLNLIHLPLAILIAATLAVRAFISFSTHYLMHMVPLLWRLHRVHHLDTELDVSTTGSVPSARVLRPVAAGRADRRGVRASTPWVLMCYELLDVAITLWTHSNVRLPAAIDHVVRYVVVTPRSASRPPFGLESPKPTATSVQSFPLWDLVFGTFRATPRDRHDRMRLGPRRGARPGCAPAVGGCWVQSLQSAWIDDDAQLHLPERVVSRLRRTA
jgi:sterol desaturase/sphingolipid hydroxylase (fatty acid hydroxylase superfamily)